MAVKVTVGFTDDDLWVAGSTRRFSIPVVDSADAAKNLTGAASIDFRLTDLAAVEGTPTTLISKALGTGVSVTDAAGGIVQVLVDASDTISLQPGDYHFEVKVVDAATDAESVTLGSARLTGSLFGT